MSDAVAPSPDEAALLERAGLDSVAGAFAYSGGEVLSKPGLGGRERIRVRLTDASGREVVWYLKRYAGGGHGGCLGRCCSAHAGGVSPARRELANIRRLQEAGVPTMRAIAFGEAVDLWGHTRSYIVVTSVPGEALSRCMDDFLDRRGGDVEAMGRFNAALVDLVARLHAAGLVHRDLYAAHIFLDETPDGPGMHLIDVARVFRPRWRRFRWRVKDLAQLKYSMPKRWVAEHWDGFLRAYLGEAGWHHRRPHRAIALKVALLRWRQRRRRRRRRRGGATT